MFHFDKANFVTREAMQHGDGWRDVSDPSLAGWAAGEFHPPAPAGVPARLASAPPPQGQTVPQRENEMKSGKEALVETVRTHTGQASRSEDGQKNADRRHITGRSLGGGPG